MRRNKLLIYIISIGIIISLGLHSYIQEKRETKMDSEYIRFHVIANSDSPEDQELKLRVRDLLLDRFKDEFRELDSIEDSRQLIRQHLAEFEAIAMEEVRRSGKPYKVEAQLGNFSFPTKSYGNLVLPAGEYEALRIVIGEGNGANWWCVMFPPLCFVDITHGIAKDSTEDSNVETSLHADSRGKEVKVEYRFKIVEWWNRLLSFISTLRKKLFLFLKGNFFLE